MALNHNIVPSETISTFGKYFQEVNDILVDSGLKDVMPYSKIIEEHIETNMSSDLHMKTLIVIFIMLSENSSAGNNDLNLEFPISATLDDISVFDKYIKILLPDIEDKSSIEYVKYITTFIRYLIIIKSQVDNFMIIKNKLAVTAEQYID